MGRKLRYYESFSLFADDDTCVFGSKRDMTRSSRKQLNQRLSPELVPDLEEAVGDARLLEQIVNASADWQLEIVHVKQLEHVPEELGRRERLRILRLQLRRVRVRMSPTCKIPKARPRRGLRASAADRDSCVDVRAGDSAQSARKAKAAAATNLWQGTCGRRLETRCCSACRRSLPQPGAARAAPSARPPSFR